MILRGCTMALALRIVTGWHFGLWWRLHVYRTVCSCGQCKRFRADFAVARQECRCPKN